MKNNILLVFLVFLYIVNLTSVKAATDSTAPVSLSAAEEKSFLESIDFKILDAEETETGIRNFDVGKEGEIALVVSENCIHVYEPTGAFRYGVYLDPYGDFVVDFQDEMFAILFVRNNYIILIDSTGECVEVQQETDQKQHLSYVLEKLNQTTKEVNGKTYYLERLIDIGATYSKLVAVDEQDKMVVLYDFSENHKTSQVILIIGITCFCSFVIWGCTKSRRSMAGDH